LLFIKNTTYGLLFDVILLIRPTSKFSMVPSSCCIYISLGIIYSQPYCNGLLQWSIAAYSVESPIAVYLALVFLARVSISHMLSAVYYRRSVCPSDRRVYHRTRSQAVAKIADL